MNATHDSPKCARLLKANKRLVQQERTVREALRAVMAWWLNSIDGKTEDDDVMPPAIFDKAIEALRADGNKEQAMATANEWPSRGLL